MISWHGNAFCIATINVWCELSSLPLQGLEHSEQTKTISFLLLPWILVSLGDRHASQVMLWCRYCEYFGENWQCYNGPTLYQKTPPVFQRGITSAIASNSSGQCGDCLRDWHRDIPSTPLEGHPCQKTNHKGVVDTTPDQPWSILIITWLNKVVSNVYKTNMFIMSAKSSRVIYLLPLWRHTSLLNGGNCSCRYPVMQCLRAWGTLSSM